MELGFDFGDGTETPPADPQPADDARADLATAENRRKVSVFETMTPHEKLRLLSEKAMEARLPWHFERGKSYHVASYGDVDALTFVKMALRQQPLDYLVLATWCMAQVDADEIARWVERGMIGRVDYVVGEVFQTHSRYRKIRDTLAKTAESTGGRVLRCRTHMKVSVCYGRDFDCVIESSANVDTNPRAEQMCITCDTALADFYKEWFDELPNFDEQPSDWEPWSRS